MPRSPSRDRSKSRSSRATYGANGGGAPADPATFPGNSGWFRGKDLGTVGASISTLIEQSGVGALLTFTNARVANYVDADIAAGTASSTFNAGSNNGDKAFDLDTGTNWISNASATGWLKAQLVTAGAAVQYTIAGANGSENRCPKNWTFEGSNNDSTWTVLDTQTNQTWTAGTGATPKTYTFANSTSYLYYRLNISANNGDTYLMIAEMTIQTAINGKAARFSGGGGIEGAIVTGGTTRELWMVATAHAAGGSLMAIGGADPGGAYPWFDGKIYDDTFIGTRQSFTPTMPVIRRRRLIRITVSGGVWTYYLDNVQQHTVSGLTFSIGAIPKVVNTIAGTVEEFLILTDISDSTRTASLISYFNTEHGLNVT